MDYRYDTDVQNDIQAELTQEISLNWDAVHGEVFTFDDPEERLPALDNLEGFYPGGEGLYRRVLIPVILTETETTVLAWTYAGEAVSGVYLPGGRWPEI